MKVQVLEDKDKLGQAAARHGAQKIREAIDARGEANIIVATGASQFEMLSHLVKEQGVAWHKVTGFHLDEYVGMPITHPASFRAYLWRRFVSQLPLPLKAFHYVEGENEPEDECQRLGGLIANKLIDVAFVGIGENGHLAFNDPPADFQVADPYLVVKLDEACRRQQLGEGWFKQLDEVPTQALSMSCRQIMASKTIVCSVPDERKAQAVQGAVEGPITPDVPASIMQKHDAATLYLDPNSASKLSDNAIAT